MNRTRGSQLWGVGLASVTAASIRGALVAIMLLLVAERIGSSEFGTFSAVFAISRLSAPVAALGASWEVQQRLAEGRSNPDAIAPGLTRGLIVSLAMTCVAALLASSLVGVGLWTSLAITSAALLPQTVRAAVLPAAFASNRSALVLGTEVLRGALQLVVVGTVAVASPSLSAVATAYWMSNALWSTAFCVIMHRSLRIAVTTAKKSFRAWRSGLSVGMAQASRSASYSIDQAMLPRLESPAASGQYALGAQIVSFAILAVGSFGESKQPRLYASAVESAYEHRAVVRRLQGQLTAIAAAVGAVCVLLAAAVWVLLSVATASVVWIAAGLAISTIFMALSYPVLSSMTAAGRHGVRNRIELCGALGNLVLNLALVPLLGVGGAVVSTLATEALLAAAGSVLLRSTLRSLESPDGRPVPPF